MMLSLSSSSIAHTTCSLFCEYPYTLPRLRPKEISSTEKTNRYPLPQSNRDVPGTLSIRFRCQRAVTEIRLVYELYPSEFRVTRSSCSETEMAIAAASFPFAVRKVLNGSFCTMDRKQSLSISVSGTERMYFFVSVLLNHQRPVVYLTSMRNAVLHALFSQECRSSTIYTDTLHRDFDFLLHTAKKSIRLHAAGMEQN
jgi:hypothetical protein